MGEMKVPADRLWAAQTQRSHENFEIGVGIETMPAEIIHAFGVLKKAAAIANHGLRPEKMTAEKIADTDEVGVVNGLAYTELGGTLLKVEVAAVPGSGKIELTGSLGDVMKESARAAVSYIRSHGDEYGIDPDFYKTKDIHIHVPEGAVPKDGPSAGVTITTALLSELTGRPVRDAISRHIVAEKSAAKPW